jgi:hemoglobin/transferrin/lactoferrin receptor protein
MRRFGPCGATALAAALGAGMLGSAYAEEADADAEGVITVTATRAATDTFNAPAPVTVITDEDIEQNLATDIKDLIRFEPGVTVRTEPSRFAAALGATGRSGNSGFNIRGLDGNRVLFQIDGIRVPDSFSFGPNSFGRGDYMDLDLLNSVEILRGPASALYGSDGFAGVVSFITKDPNDFLEPGETFGLRGRAAYASADESFAEGLTAAGRIGLFSGLLAYTHRDSHETENQGENEALNSTRTAPNPQDIASNAVLARLVFEPNANHRIRLTGDYSDREIVTEAYTARAVAPAPPAVYASTAVIDLDGLDESERARVALDYTFDNEGGVFNRVFAAVYYQESWLRQFSDEDRFTAADRTRDTTYDNDVWGANVQADLVFATGAAQHRLIVGGDYSLSTQGAIRNGTTPTPPAVFPERPFPETEYARAGVFVVDEISFLGGALAIFPALRYDYYDLEPQDDALYAGTLAGQEDSHVSPKLGIVAWPTETFGLFFSYGAGFKAPAPAEVNNYFENLTFPGSAYTSISNPELKPETSESVEAGLRFRDISLLGATWRASGSVFQSWYEDFISQEIVGGDGQVATPFLYQYVNLAEFETWGVEARADAAWENGLGFTIAASFAEGDFTSGGVTSPYGAIDPWRIVAGLSYTEPQGRLGGQVILTHASRKDSDRAAPTAYRPDGFTIGDITAFWNITEAATLRVGVFNITDEKYAWWSDVRGLTGLPAARDAYTQPGRNYSASISYRF